MPDLPDSGAPKTVCIIMGLWVADVSPGQRTEGLHGGEEEERMSWNQAVRDWRVKALIQGILSVTPGGGRLNDWLQTSAGGLRNFEDNISGKIEDWLQLVSYLQTVSRGEMDGLAILEVGSGWYPTLPFCFALVGAGRIYTVDLHRHMNEAMTFRMLRAMEPHLDRIANACAISPDSTRQRWEELRQADALAPLLAKARVEYRAPGDARKLAWLSDGCIDMAYSNSVLEHVTPAVLPGIMREAWRVLSDDGVMVHAVACNDHYAHFDPAISFVNYLQFSERRWRWYNNDLHYQNRLRAPDFLHAARENGFEILHEARAVRPRTREALAHMRLAPEFRSYGLEDLAATTIDFVAAKRARGV